MMRQVLSRQAGRRYPAITSSRWSMYSPSISELSSFHRSEIRREDEDISRQVNEAFPSTTKFSRSYSTTNKKFYASSPFAVGDGNGKPTRRPPRKKKNFIPKKAAVTLTERSREFFKRLLETKDPKVFAGIVLNYGQSSTGEPRMVFSFDFIKHDSLTADDEGVSLEVLEDGSPKSPEDSLNDGLPKLYVHHNAFMKVLGAKVDIDFDTLTPILYDREGNQMDPNF